MVQTSGYISLTRCCALLLISSLACQGLLAQTKPGKASKASSEIQKLFGEPEVLKIEIEIPDSGMEVLKKYQWTFGPQPEREDVQATVREGTMVYTNVSLHLKGSAGSFRPIDDKPAFTLNFDKNVKGQHFHGLDKISLNNSVQDPTYISEQFSRELFLQAGVPTPRATHALVKLNGKDVGLYVLVEGWDKEFLKQHFKKPKGNLYDGGFVKDVTDTLSLNAGGGQEDRSEGKGDNGKEKKNSKKHLDQSDRKALAEAAQEPDLQKRAARLEKVLDMDRFLTFVALDVMLWNWDGYAMNKNNWRLYHDLETDKMVFLPHGLDQMFWKPDGSILPRMNGLVAQAVLEVPEFRARYFERVKQLRKNVFKVESLTNRVAQLDAKVRPALLAAEPEAIKEHDQLVTGFSSAIARRAVSIDNQLAHPPEPMKFDASGTVSLVDWKSKSDFGKPSFSESKDQAAKGSLQVEAKDGSSIGSWRTTFWLERGHYRMEAKVKTQGLVADPGDPRAGAGIRMASGRPADYLKGDSDWKPLQVEIDVPEAFREVQLICEFRGAEGKAWFDLDSMRLKRVGN